MTFIHLAIKGIAIRVGQVKDDPTLRLLTSLGLVLNSENEVILSTGPIMAPWAISIVQVLLYCKRVL